MEMNPWLVASLWVGVALVATMFSIRLGISVALVGIGVGVLAGNLLHLSMLPAPQDSNFYIAARSKSSRRFAACCVLLRSGSTLGQMPAPVATKFSHLPKSLGSCWAAA
jgi:hypothetical protein